MLGGWGWCWEALLVIVVAVGGTEGGRVGLLVLLSLNQNRVGERCVYREGERVCEVYFCCFSEMNYG